MLPPPLRTALPSSTTPSPARSGALTRSGPAFHQVFSAALQRPRAYHQGSFLFSRPYSGNPRSFLFLSLLICLSPGHPPALRASSGCAPAARFSHSLRPSSPPEPSDPIQECVAPLLLFASAACFPYRAGHCHASPPRCTLPTRVCATAPLLARLARHHHPQCRNDPAAGSPTATLLRLTSYLVRAIRDSRPSSPRPSEIVTGGVYKLQGHIHRGLMSRRY